MSQFFRMLFAVLVTVYGCKGKTQAEAEKTLGNISNELKSNTPMSTPDPEGIYMTAVIDGKKWVATQMTPDYSLNSNYKMIDGSTKEYSINFNIYKPQTGSKRELNDDYLISFMTWEDYYSGKNGEVEVTMADDFWVEGNFHFTASSSRSGKTFKVTNGFFRVARNDPGK